MPLYLNKGFKEKNQSIFIAPNSFIVGNVALEKGTSVWFGTNIRSDDKKTVIREGTAILENSYIEDSIIGKNCVISHGAIVHNATIGDNVFIGLGARILNNAKIGDNCFIGTGTLILPGRIVEPETVVVGQPGKVLRKVTSQDLNITKEAVKKICKNAKKYAKLLNIEDD